MKAEDFIDFAGRVAALSEAGSRSAVSRAYYGAFHLAIELLRELGCKLAARESHGFVSILFENAGVEDARNAGRLLAALRSDRVAADYSLDDKQVGTSKFAMQSVESAHEIRIRLTAVRIACQNQVVRDHLCNAINAQLEILKGRRSPPS